MPPRVDAGAAAPSAPPLHATAVGLCTQRTSSYGTSVDTMNKDKMISTVRLNACRLCDCLKINQSINQSIIRLLIRRITRLPQMQAGFTNELGCVKAIIRI